MSESDQTATESLALKPGAPRVVPLFKPMNEECVRILREALKLAEEGTAIEVAIVAKCNDGSIFTDFTKCENQFERIGHVNRLLYRMLKGMDG